MILAAGRGERMRPLTDSVPKPLIPVAGEPLILRHVAALVRAGVREIVVNLAWHGAQIRAALGDGSRFGASISYSEEPQGALETGGGIFQALPLLGTQPFLVVNGDTFTELTFGHLALEPQALAHLVLVPNPPQHPNGDFCLDADGFVNVDTGPRFTYSGIGVYHPDLFDGCEPGRFPLLPLLKKAIAAQRLRGEVFAGVWSDVGTVERLQALEKALKIRS